VLNASGAVESRHDYLPFGEEIPVSVGNRSAAGYEIPSFLRQKFTGKERDEAANEAGLDYFLARYYASPQGRFLTPDAPFADQQAADPQSWNLYAYGRNSPLKFVDRNGRECVTTDDGATADDGKNQPCTAAQLGSSGTFSVSLPYSELGYLALSHAGANLGSSHQWAVITSQGGQWADASWGLKSIGEASALLGRWAYRRALKSITLRLMGRPNWASGAGGFVNWLRNLQRSGRTLTHAEADALIDEATRLGVDVRLDPPHPGTGWDAPHLNFGKEGQAHLMVPSDYSHHAVKIGSVSRPR
jgi:RHS repeat-associated protein